MFRPEETCTSIATMPPSIDTKSFLYGSDLQCDSPFPEPFPQLRFSMTIELEET
jgi:hypothetical protein